MHLADSTSTHSDLRRRAAGVALPAAIFLCAFIARTWGISRHFWLYGDQIRDWSIALRPFWELPLVGPPTHFGGYTIGPAFYWIVWVIRVVVGPWFENLPHAGGIGQALLQSGVDALLLVAIWKRAHSVWLALAAVVLVVFAPYDLALSSVLWNPVMGSTLAKAAMGLILLDWPRPSLVRAGVAAAVAWCAVHCYTGAIFVALSVFAALIVTPLLHGDHRAAWQRALVVASVVAALQLPYLAHRIWGEPGGGGVGAVVGSLERVASGSSGPRLGDSVSAYVAAFNDIQVAPWRIAAIGWFVAACALLVVVRHWRDPVLLTVTIVPQAAAVLGYALWLGELESYYYLSLMPAMALTVLLGVTAAFSGRAARVAGFALLVGALLITPARLRLAATIHRMPEYAVLVEASRAMLKRGEPVRAVRAYFLQPTADPEFIFRILGGRIDPAARWVVTISPDAQITYQPVQAP